MGRRQAAWGVLVAVASALGVALSIRRVAAPPAGPRVDGLVESQLAALGYAPDVSDDPSPEQRGVVTHDAARASRGVNVYCSVHRDSVHFLDMDGAELHRLTLPDAGDGADCMLESYDEHSFLALTSPRLSRLDWDSRVLWTRSDGHHHDVAVDGAGRIYGWIEKPGFRRHRGRDLPLRDHVLERMRPDGTPIDTLRLSKLFGDAIPEARLDRMADLLSREGAESAAYRRSSDVFHPNTLEVLDREIAVAREGQILICIRELDRIAILDLESRSVVWQWGQGELDRPHHPTLLENGHLLIFDNGAQRGRSRVIELDPRAGEIVWSYVGRPPGSFFSEVRGSAQQLPNGNVLITESTRGRVFEVTRDGEIVWSFANPELDERGRRLQIYRLFRVPPERFAGWHAAASRAAALRR